MRNLTIGIILLAELTERVTFPGVLFGFDLRFWYLLLLAGVIILLISNRIYLPIELKYLTLYLIMHSALVFLVVGKLGFFTYLQIMLFLTTTLILYSLIRYIGLIQALKVFELGAIILSMFIIFENIAHALYGINFYATELIGPFVKARGILREPSEAAILISPAILCTLIWKEKLKTIVLVAGVVFSFSALAMISMIAAFGLYMVFSFKRGHYISSFFFAVLILGASILVILLIPTFQSRVDSALLAPDVVASSDADINDYKNLNGSVATLVLNSQVATLSLLSTYGFGVGFGNYRSAFNDFAPSIIDIGSIEGLFYNRNSGGSLLVRSIAEMGFWGPSLFIIFAIWAYRRFVLCSKLANYSKYIVPNVVAWGIGLTVMLTFMIRKDMWFSWNLSFFLGLVILSAQYHKFICIPFRTENESSKHH